MINQLPTNITKYFPEYRGMHLEEIISQAKRRSRPRMKKATQAIYITMFRSVLDYAEKEKYINSNPARDLMPLGDKAPARKAREAFETDDLRKIFSSGQFTSRAEDESERFGRFSFPYFPACV